MSFYEKIRDNGILPDYDEELRFHLQVTNMLILFMAFMALFLQFTVFIKTWQTFLLLFIPQIIYFLSFFLIKKGQNKLGRFIFTVGVPVYIYFVAALIYNINYSSGLVAKLLLATMMILPFVTFSLREWQYIVVSVFIDLGLIMSFDQVNDALTIKDLGFNFDNAYYNILGILTSVFVMSFVVFVYKRILAKREDEIMNLLEELKLKNKQLSEVKHELYENNSELKSLNELLNKQKQELVRRNRFFYTLAHNATDAIIIVSSKRKIIFWNKAAEKIFGYREDEALTKDFMSLTGIFDMKELKEDHEFMISSKIYTSKALEAKARTKRGEVINIFLSVSIVPVLDTIYSLNIIRDITEQKRLHEQINRQKLIIEQAYKEMEESLIYARHILSNLTAGLEEIKNFFSDYFLVFMPKSQVGGDFYFVKSFNDKIFVAVGDCTGHGVPGALLATLAISFLNEIINYDITPAQVLNVLRNKVKKSLGEKNKEQGLDMAIISYQKGAKELIFAGAYLPLLIVKNGQIQVIRANHMPVGAFVIEKEFCNDEVNISPGMMIYFITDGFADQLNFEGTKKFSRRRLFSLLQEISKHPVHQQERILWQTLDQWKQNYPQIDDITVLGIKV